MPATSVAAVDPAAAQHARLGFPLTGRHARRPCADCHSAISPQGKLARGDAARSCLPCHADVHEGSLKADCRRCHSSVTWQTKNTFDHNQKTAFRLEGQHQSAANRNRCQGCHPGWRTRFTPISSQCGDARCHANDDTHKGAFGPRCGDCHTSAEAFSKGIRDWTRGHAMAPQPFGGAHDVVAKQSGCGTCHGERRLRGMGGQCVTCHQRDDIHHNSLGPRCGDCHTQRSFVNGRFRHDTVGCTLRGVHRTLPCVDCHKGGNYAGLSPLCVSCHRDDAMRAAGQVIRIPENPTVPELHGVQTACTRCHNTLSFRMGAGTRQSPPESVCQ